MSLGERLRAAIDRKNKSHAWVADEIEMTAASWSSILTGKTRDPSFFTVLAIARAIEEPLSAIVDDPLHYWSAEDLKRLNEIGVWLTERTTRKGAGAPLDIPPRRKSGHGHSRVYPAVAGNVAVHPDAFEVRNQQIPKKFAKDHATAVFSVQGESMTGARLYPGDLLYVRLTPDPAEAINRIVVCTVDDMVLVKRLRVQNRKIVLESANPAFKPIVVDEMSTRFRLVGTVIGSSPDRK